MEVARLHIVYSLLLAHGLGLDEGMEKSLTKRFGNIYGAAIAPPVGAIEIDQVRWQWLREFIISRDQWRDQWQCVKHHWYDCFICTPGVFTPLIDPAALAAFESQRLIADHFPARPIKIAQVPSEYGMLIAAEWLSRHLDLEGVPGFYREEIREPLPGAPAEAQMLGWFKDRIKVQSPKSKVQSPFVWRTNFPAPLMNRAARTAFVVPYDNGTGQILGLRIYRSVRDQYPTVLTSRGLPGGHAAVAAI